MCSFINLHLYILSTSTYPALWFPAFIVALVFATAAVEVSKAVALNTDIKDDGFTQTSKETETGKLDGKEGYEYPEINVDVGKEQEVSDETEVAHVDGVSYLDEGNDTDFDNRVFKRRTVVWGQGVLGVLDVHVRYGHGLRDSDRFPFGDSDPYVEVIAYDNYGNAVRMTTSTDRNDDSPYWNQNLNFGRRAWNRFTVQVWDRDIGYDDALSNRQTRYLSSTTPHCSNNPTDCSNIRHNAHSGYAMFDYTFQ